MYMAFTNGAFGSLITKEFKGDATISKISPSMKGKVICVYGGNNLGKTKQMTSFDNCIVIPAEKGLNAINGAMVLKTDSWESLQRNIKKLTTKKMVKALKESKEPIFIVVDGIERIGNYCKAYLCEKYDVATIGKANGGFGAWEEYENNVWGAVDRLISVGYCVIFNGHEKLDSKKDKYVITGDERAIKPIRDNADIVAYVKSNGIDSEGNEILSSAYFVETDEFFARTRFTYMTKMIEEFTAENLQNAIIDGINAQIEAEGLDADVTFEEQQSIYNIEEMSVEELQEACKEIFMKVQESEDEDLIEEYMDIVNEHLGGDMPISQAGRKQIPQLKLILTDLELLAEDNDL